MPINLAFRNTFQWNSNKKSGIQEKAMEHAYQMTAILD